MEPRRTTYLCAPCAPQRQVIQNVSESGVEIQVFVEIANDVLIVFRSFVRESGCSFKFYRGNSGIIEIVS